MSLLNPATFCVHVQTTPFGCESIKQPLNIRFPGGALLEAAAGAPQDAVEALIVQLNAALTPLTPIFDLCDVMIVAKKLFDKLKTLDVIGLARVFPQFQQAIDRLLSLVPAVSAVHLVLDIIDALIAFLCVLHAQITAILKTQVKVSFALLRAGQLASVDLAVVAACGQGHIDFSLSAVYGTGAPLNRLIALINLIGGSAGLPELPSLSFPAGASESLVVIDTVVRALSVVRGHIPA